jgi:tetratricopeptide (TPR) repeat protein
MDSSAVPSSGLRKRLLLPALVALFTVAAFLPSAFGEFLLWDDDANFLFNEHYRGFSAENLRWMFTNAYGHYMPLTWLSCGLDYALWGMNPAGYHATNLALHALNAVLFFLLLGKLLRHAAPDLAEPTAGVAAAAGALCFSLHPLRVESVAWITERRDLLSGAFFLLTAIAYVRHAEEPERGPGRWKWLALSSLAFAAMLLSKTMGLSLPLVFLVLDVYPLRRWSRAAAPRLLAEKLPLFALMAGALVMLSISAGRAGGMSDRSNYPLLQSLGRPGYALTFYLSKTLFPIGLSPLYWYRPELGLRHAVGWAGLLGLSALLLVWRRRFPAALAAWMAYGLLIAPASGLVSMGSFTGADHYTYVACLPFAAMGAALAVALSRRWSLAVAGGVLATILLAFATLTWRYCGVWTDSVSLWSRAVELDPDVYFSRANLGRSLAAKGRLDQALVELDRSIELQSGWYESFGYRARTRLLRHDLMGTIEDSTRAVRLKPDWGEGFNLRAQALSRLGRPQEAIADFSRALELRPQFMEARIGRAADRSKLGDLEGAIADLDEAIHFDPQPSIYVRRGVARAMRQDLPGAAGDFARALELAPPDWPQRPQVQEYLDRSRASK